jgi:uroporphyrinogen-III synthase
MKVFVSRSLAPNSPLISMTSDRPVEWTCFSLIEFRKIDFSLPETDWLFFYSATGVTFFKEGLAEEDLLSMQDVRIGCYGPATANKFKDAFGIACDYVGTGNAGRDLADFLQVTGEDQIIFVQARNSKNAIQQLMTDRQNFSSLEVYENSGKKSLTLGRFHIAILTSPLNAETFHQSGGCADHYIAIGETTAKKMRDLSFKSVHTSKEPSESSIADLLLQLIE